jgi:predicted transcriptional regulator
MAKPKTVSFKTVNFTMRLDEDVKDLIEQVAEATDRTMSGFIKHAIRRAVDDYIRKGVFQQPTAATRATIEKFLNYHD